MIADFNGLLACCAPLLLYFPISEWGEFYSDDIFTCQLSTFLQFNSQKQSSRCLAVAQGSRECGGSVSVFQLQMHGKIGETDTWAKVTCRIGDLYISRCVCNIHPLSLSIHRSLHSRWRVWNFLSPWCTCRATHTNSGTVRQMNFQVKLWVYTFVVLDWGNYQVNVNTKSSSLMVY